jgi:hypothetical protein
MLPAHPAAILILPGQDPEGDYQDVARRMGARRGFAKPVVIADVLLAPRDEGMR